MGLPGFFFYIFSTVLLASGMMVIAARNPVHSVLFLILAFVNAAGLFLLLGAEFLALILIIVYVGAVAVLFLFVVMMLDVDFVELKQGFLTYLPTGGVIAGILVAEILVVIGGSTISPEQISGAAVPIVDVEQVGNTEAIGAVLYTDYLFYFQLAGLVLLVAMIGAIVLTLRHKPGVKRQSIAEQVARNPATSIEVRKVEPGRGA
ncbi:MAG: NADH-quinone oxidoreductase subunit J [Alphaproteobacteria bacterium]